MAFASQDNQSVPGPSSGSRSDIDSPHSPDPASAIRLRFLVPNPHDSVALSKTLVDIIKDVQATRRSQDGNAYVLSADQFDDLLLLALQNNRNASASGLASIENQLTELTNKITDVQHAVRGTRPWSRPDPLPPNGYTPLVPISDNTPPSTSYGGGSARERQPVGFVGADGRIYGLTDDQRRMWPYPSERPTWSRDYDHSRPSAAATGELPPWYPIGRRSSREEGTQPPSGDHHQHVVPRPEPGSSAAANSAYDRDREPVRPITANRRSPGPGNHTTGGPPPPSMATMQFPSEKPTRPTHHHMVPPLSSSSGNNHTPASTAVTDSSSKAPSISFLVNPSYESPSRVVARESRSPPPTHPPLPHPLPHRYEHNGMDVDGHHHHRSMPDGIDGTGPFSHPGHSKSSSKSGSRSDITAPGKRRIRNGACTFCREKKLACRPGPMADDPNHTGPPTCDQCYRRQRTCQHDPEHRRRRRTTALPPKKPSGDSDGAKSNGAAAVEVDVPEDMTTRMESEDPSIPTGDSAGDRRTPRPTTAATEEGVKDEEVDQLDWMQPD